MKVMWKAACAAVLIIAACSIEIGCGETYRPIAVPLPVTTGNPAGAETEVVLNTADGINSVVTNINVSGDSNAGNKSLGNVANSVAFDANRTMVYTTNTTPANTTSASVTQLLLAASTAGFAANTTTISLDPGSQPIGMSFQYFGTTYTQDYVVNSGITTPTCQAVVADNKQLGVASLGAIVQASSQLKATICLGVNPVFAWIYRDQTKVFVLDKSEDQVYVVSATKYKWTNKIGLCTPQPTTGTGCGKAPIKATQSTDGSYLYVLNSDSTISIIDAQAETLKSTLSLSASAPIDIAQDVQFNRIWVLQANGTVSTFDATTPGVLTLVNSAATTSTISATATPTNLALMRDGTQAYVGIAGTDQIVVIRASDFTTNAITVGVHRTIQQTIGSQNVIVEQTSPMVNYVAVSRDNTKAYATTTTNTSYFYYDASGNQVSAPVPTPTGCTVSGNALSCANLYNGTAVVTSASNGTTPINTYVTTVPAPSVVTYCNPGNPATGEYDGQKNCPAMTPVMVLGRS